MKIEDVKKDLGEDAELFDYEEKDGVVAAKLKKFYSDRNEWAKIAQRAKDKANAVYVPKDKGGPYFVFKGETEEKATAPIVISQPSSEKQNEKLFQAATVIHQASKKLKELGF